MKELLRTQNPAKLALIKSLLQSADIKFFVFDENMGSLGLTVYGLCRIMVLDDELQDALNILNEGNILSG